MFIKYLLFIFSAVIYASSDRPYHTTPDREKDIIHMSIDVEVDIEIQQISGNVSHTFTPFSSHCERISFDTESTTIHRVTTKNKNLKYQLSGSKIWIELDKAYGWEDTITVNIDFTSNPQMGFYFISPDSSYPDKKLQAWTQGEDTENHYWVPLHDYPNDKMTWECKIKIDNPLVAISNGKLLSVKDLKNQRIFHWQESIPNVSYLLSIAVGEYKKIEDRWEKTPVNYWVYPEHSREDALRSFGKTPAMIGFFSDITGVRYPFEKYDQTIIEDFMWGGMENVTNTHQTDRTMHGETARPNHTSDGLVAHELAHQWFGDYLTTRNWPNIWLNEGFATYMELLWTEHESGMELAEYERLENLLETVRADQSYRRSTVQHHYYNSIELFDSNVYAKGSVILNMIRKILGDDAFFRGLKFYAQSNAGKNVETQDLEKAFEITSGKNLDWFFDQWVYKPGMPEITAKTDYNRKSQMVTLKLLQTQNTDSTSLFKLPMTVLIDDGTLHRHTVFFDQKEATFTFPSAIDPLMVIVDEGFQITKRLNFDKKTDELIYQLQHAPSPNDRIWAGKELAKSVVSKKIQTALTEALQREEKWYVQKQIVKTYKSLKPRNGETALIAFFPGKDPRVQEEIIKTLEVYKSEPVKTFLVQVLENESNDFLISAAMSTLIKVDLAMAKTKFDWAMGQDTHEDRIKKAALAVLSEEKNDSNLTQLKVLAKYGIASYNIRGTVFRHIAAYSKDHPELVEFFRENLNDKSREVRWVCADQLIQNGSYKQFIEVLEMAESEPLRGGKIAEIHTTLESRLTKSKKSRDSKMNRELLQMQKLFNEKAREWSSK